MTLKEIQHKADSPDKKIVVLQDFDLIQEGDYLEWIPNTYTTIDKGSCYIGKTQGEVAKTSPRIYKVIRIVSITS